MQIAQGIIVSGWFVIGTYTPEVFSTDTRSFMFAALDGTSKVVYTNLQMNSVLMYRAWLKGGP